MSTLHFRKKMQCRFCGKMNDHVCTFEVNDLVYDRDKLTLSENDPIQDDCFPEDLITVEGHMENNCDDQNCEKLEKKYPLYNGKVVGLFFQKMFKGLVLPVKNLVGA